MSRKSVSCTRLARILTVAGLTLAVSLGAVACSGGSAKLGPGGTASTGGLDSTGTSTLSSDSAGPSHGDAVSVLQKAATKSHDVQQTHVVTVLDLFIGGNKHIEFDGDIDRAANSGDVKIDNSGTTYELRSDGTTIWVSGAPLAAISAGKQWVSVSDADASGAGLSKLTDTTVFDSLYALAGITKVTDTSKTSDGTEYEFDVDLDKAASALSPQQADALQSAFHATGAGVTVTGVATIDGKGYISHLKLTATSAVSGGSPIISAEVTLTNINKAFTVTPPAPSDVTPVTPAELKQALPSS